MDSTTTRGCDDRVAHYSEAYRHCRRGMVRLRRELDRATALASRKDRQRRLLAKEWAESGRKVQFLAALVKEYEKAVLEARKSERAALDTLAALRSESSVVGL